MTVEIILDRVEAEIQTPKFQNKVIATAQILMAKRHKAIDRCSYSCYMSTYVKLKLNIRRLERKFEFTQIDNRAEIDELKNNLAMVHKYMYLRPCKVCLTCINRKKTWN